MSENYFVLGVDNSFSGRKEKLAFMGASRLFFMSVRHGGGLLGTSRPDTSDLDAGFHLAAIVSVPYSVRAS